jgi:hypothetical protein
VDGYLRKPVVAEALLSEVKRFLPERRDGQDERQKDGGQAGVAAVGAGGG